MMGRASLYPESFGVCSQPRHLSTLTEQLPRILCWAARNIARMTWSLQAKSHSRWILRGSTVHRSEQSVFEGDRLSPRRVLRSVQRSAHLLTDEEEGNDMTEH